MSDMSSTSCDSVHLNTNYEVGSIDCHWKIRNFSVLSLFKIIHSPIFSTSDKYELKWRLDLYPKWEKFKNKKYVGIFPFLVDAIDENINASYILTLFKSDGSEISFSFIYCFKRNQSYGSSISIEYDLIREEYLINDTLCITCKIKWYTYDVKCYSQNLPDVNTGGLDLGKNLYKDISSLHQDDQLSDISLEVENVKFRVHKIILAARSSVFAEKFKNESEDTVKIEEVKPKIVKAMISYIYTGHVEDIDTKALELLKVAENYDVD